jgi:CheY-like chemotaxis protein
MVLDRYSAPVLGKDGKNYGRTWTFRDITDRKQAEEKLKTALLKAEASDKLKTAFINNISHEVRTPINGILGFGQFMLDPNLSQEEKELYFGILDKSTHRLISTITGIMDISLIVSGSMKVHKKTFYVKQLLDEIRRSYVKQCAEKNLPLCLDIPEENMEIHTDAGLLEKTLLHLLSNAVKFTHTGSITFGYTVGSSFLRFFVRDTGVGIKPEARNKIFGIFMQEDTSDTRGYEGCGLGLSIARGMVELLGGEIGFESVKGKGSTFFFTIPSPAAEIPSSVSEIPSSAAETPSPAAEIQPVILIAEDDETCYAYIKAILKNSSVELLSVLTGNEAVKKCLERTDISLILMDLKMPDMNGLEATKLIKSFRKNLPVIAVTAHAASGDEHKAISAGCDDYISKPYEKDLLIRKLGKYGIVIE